MLTDEEATACDSVPDAVCMSPPRPLTTGALNCLVDLELEQTPESAAAGAGAFGWSRRGVSDVSCAVEWDAEVDQEAREDVEVEDAYDPEASWADEEDDDDDDDDDDKMDTEGDRVKVQADALVVAAARFIV